MLLNMGRLKFSPLGWYELARAPAAPAGRCVRTGGARMAVGCPGEAPGPSVAPRAAPLALACCCCSAHAACSGGRFPRLRALASRARGRRGRVRAPARPAPPLPSRRSRPPPAPREHWRSGVCASAALSTPARARGACAWAERMRVPPTGRPPPLCLRIAARRRRPRSSSIIGSLWVGAFNGACIVAGVNSAAEDRRD